MTKAEMKTEITNDDIVPMETYGSSRTERRRKIIELKRNRKLFIGPDATLHFENYDTIFHQIHEMLWIEKGGEEQLKDELVAYNPLIPNGFELVATLMFEIEDPVRRVNVLNGLGGVENSVFLAFNGIKKVLAVAEDDLDRTDANGKASSVQFLHFDFEKKHIEQFKDSAIEVSVGIAHENYSHTAIIPEKVRESLSKDFFV